MNQVPAKTTFRDVAIADHGGGGKLMPQSFGDVVEFSKIMALSQHAIPKHLRDVPGACLAVTMQAMRWELDPFAVASKSYNVKDIIAYEAQLIAAVVHIRAPLKTRPNYEYTGEGPDRRCKVSAEFNDGVTRAYESPRIADIVVKNSPLWKADPDQQLGYYSIRAFARRYCPEVILGVYTPEEAEEFRGPDNARDLNPRPSLADKLGTPNGNGFSQQHVINEIDGNNSEASQSRGPGDATPPAADSEHHAAGTLSAAPDAAGQPDRTEPMAEPNDGGDHALDSEASREIIEQTARDAASLENGSSGVTSAGGEQPATLYDGWEKDYALALRRATRKDSLAKLALQFWAIKKITWDEFKHTEDGKTAQLIYDAFKNNFGHKDEIDAQLRELGAL